MSKYKMIKVEDSKESILNATKELYDNMMKGGGIGFDLSDLPKDTSEKIQSEINDQMDNVTIVPRMAHRQIFIPNDSK